MDYIIVFGIVFVVVSVIYYIILRRSSKKKKLNKIKEITILVNRYNLDIKKINKNDVFMVMSFINGFIISLVSLILMVIPFDNYLYILLGFVVGFFVLMLMIYACYEIYGRYLNKRIGVDKDE